MTTLTSTEAIEAAVTWWVQNIQQPKFDAGADSPEMHMAQIIATTLAQPVTKEQLYTFSIELTDSMLKKKHYYNGFIGVDYHPDLVLSEAAKKAGISENNFPWKTNMRIKDDKVVVWHGYGAEEQIIYEAECKE